MQVVTVELSQKELKEILGQMGKLDDDEFSMIRPKEDQLSGSETARLVDKLKENYSKMSRPHPDDPLTPEEIEDLERQLEQYHAANPKQPAWVEITTLMAKHGINAFPIALRDELTTHLVSHRKLQELQRRGLDYDKLDEIIEAEKVALRDRIAALHKSGSLISDETSEDHT